MTNNNHPITPPPELVQQWIIESRHQDYCSSTDYAIAKAARWGADQELEACCEHLQRSMSPRATIDYLRAARRPKPPSLKEQALEALKHAEEGWRPVLADCAIIRRALEFLPDNIT